MEKLKEILRGEIEAFREKGHKFLSGEMSKMDFKHASGGFGVYAQRDGKKFMIRLRIPSGVTDVGELKKVYNFAEKYGVSKIHFTTRQALQLHDMDIDEVCDLMEEALDYDIYTRGSGGNFPRNVALSPLAGVNVNEPFDPTPYALAVGNYFLERIYTYKLPRKLKVSFSSTSADGAHCTVQDLGFIAVKNDNKNAFQIYLGGGLGQNPKVAVKYPELIEPEEVLYYVEAMVKFFMAEGDYNNKARARVRYILDKMGEEEFISSYKKFVEAEKSQGHMDVKVQPREINKPGKSTSIEDERLYKQKQHGLYSVYVHPIGGQLSVENLKKIIVALEKFDDIDIRLAMTEGVYIRNLNGEEAEAMLKLTEDITCHSKVDQSIACIGAPTCQMGLGDSQGLLKSIIVNLEGKGLDKGILPRIYISGCGNSCGVHQVGPIGFTGKKKKIDGEMQDCFTLFLGGSFAVGKTKLGDVYGDLPADKIPEFLCELAASIKKSNTTFDEYIVKHKEELHAIVEKYVA